MNQRMVIEKLHWRSFIKLCFVGNVVFFGLVSPFLIIFNFVGGPFVKWEDEIVTGDIALIVGPLVIVLLGLLVALFQSFCAYLGLCALLNFRAIEIERIYEKSGNA